MQSLGGYTFYWNPDKMSIPEKKKRVSRVTTYGGSAIFEWAAILQGTQVTLEWTYMPKGMYAALREMYLQTGTGFTWDPKVGGTKFGVVITDLAGEYHEVVNHGGSYRQRVKLALDIRTITTTATSTSTTTTTT